MNAASAQSTFTTPVPASVVGPTLLSLLIVDDDRFVRDTCREAASSLGYRASSTESPEQAVRAIESQNIDVVFFDLKQPAAGGLEALQRMKSLRPDLEIIVITGHGTVQTAVQAMKAGAYDFCHQTLHPGRTQNPAGKSCHTSETQDREPRVA
jgi:DNA-binding NtrC family response regulator